MAKASLQRSFERSQIVAGVPCTVVHETLADVADSGAAGAVLGHNCRFEFLQRWRLRNLLVPRELKRVVVSRKVQESKESGQAQDLFFVTIEGEAKAPEQVATEDEALKKAREVIRRLFFGS